MEPVDKPAPWSYTLGKKSIEVVPVPVVTMSSKGQIVIPQQLRKRLGMREGSKITVEATQDAIVLRPAGRGERGWRRWRGAFPGKKLTNALAEEHAAEIRRDATRRR